MIGQQKNNRTLKLPEVEKLWKEVLDKCLESLHPVSKIPNRKMPSVQITSTIRCLHFEVPCLKMAPFHEYNFAFFNITNQELH